MLLPPVLFDCPLPSPSHCPLMSSVERHGQCSAGYPIQNQGVGNRSPPFQPRIPSEVPPSLKAFLLSIRRRPICQLASSPLKGFRFSSFVYEACSHPLSPSPCPQPFANDLPYHLKRSPLLHVSRRQADGIDVSSSPKSPRLHCSGHLAEGQRLLGPRLHGPEAARGRVWELGGVCAPAPRERWQSHFSGLLRTINS